MRDGIMPQNTMLTAIIPKSIKTPFKSVSPSVTNQQRDQNLLLLREMLPCPGKKT
jgi:hypothetical protein